MVTAGNLENLVAPGVLPNIEVSGSAVHVVRRDVVQVVVAGEGVAIVLGLGKVVCQVDRVTVGDLLVDREGYRVGAVWSRNCVCPVPVTDVIKWRREACCRVGWWWNIDVHHRLEVWR